jgi:hypothetical protein
VASTLVFNPAARPTILNTILEAVLTALPETVNQLFTGTPTPPRSGDGGLLGRISEQPANDSFGFVLYALLLAGSLRFFGRGRSTRVEARVRLERFAGRDQR